MLSPYFVADIKNFFSILLQTFTARMLRELWRQECCKNRNGKQCANDSQKVPETPYQLKMRISRMGAGMGERKNDVRGYGSHLPKQSPNPTPTFTCPTSLRTFTLGSHAIYRSRPPTPPYLLLRAAQRIRQRRLGTGSVVWVGIPSGQNVGMSCDVGMLGGVPERPAA